MADDSISCACENEVELSDKNQSIFQFSDFIRPIISIILLVVAYLSYQYLPDTISKWVAFPLLIASYLLVGYNVLKTAFQLLKKGNFFNEFMLMSLATFGAFYIGEYLEGVFVMLFYSTGEIIQGNAVRSVRQSIKNLLDLQVRNVICIRDGKKEELKPEDIRVGDLVQVLAGEMLPLDGRVLEDDVHINTANITGESLTRIYTKGEILLAGMICVERPFVYEVTASWDDSYISKIMHLVEDASHKKAKTQRLISRLAKVYTPIVFFLSLALVGIPYFFDPDYSFNKWLYRGLVFLVISCPCAFLIAIPLSYFGGIGLAAKKGILLKGGEVIEKLNALKSVVFDKTGTLTYGKYTIQSIDIKEDKNSSLSFLHELESHSTHPLAGTLKKELVDYASSIKAEKIREYPGLGIEGSFDNKLFLAGNRDWLISKEIDINSPMDALPTVHLAYDTIYLGKISFTDQIKDNAKEVIQELRSLHIDELAMLSGDKQEVADSIGDALNLNFVKGELLPEDKVNYFLELRDKYPPAAFVGDGVNDAPVIASADVGIAMGAHGSESAIQSADMIIEDDNLEKIPIAIKIAHKTQNNVWQNLLFAVIVKVLVLILGAMGYAGLWEAIFADVGVALLVVLNAYRLKNSSF